MLKAVTRQSSAVDAKVRAINADRAGKLEISTAYFFDHYSTKEDISVMVTEADFLAANDELIPSVSAGELAHYEKVRATFEGSRDKQPKASVPALDNRPSSASSRGRLSTKSQGKMAVSNKGKGRATAADIDGDDEYDEDSDGTPSGAVNGRAKGKGKALMGFQDGTASDDDGLY
jgi:peroxin-6